MAEEAPCCVALEAARCVAEEAACCVALEALSMVAAEAACSCCAENRVTVALVEEVVPLTFLAVTTTGSTAPLEYPPKVAEFVDVDRGVAATPFTV